MIAMKSLFLKQLVIQVASFLLSAQRIFKTKYNGIILKFFITCQMTHAGYVYNRIVSFI